jgi:GAF domain/Sel1 repeat
MDRSVQTLPDPGASRPDERRRSIRQKLHSPVYASFNRPETGIVVDLSELLDLNEEGFAVQTGEKLEVNRALTLCLELPETKSYIHGSGQVIWSDDTGRGGIRFAALPENSQRILKEWLLANLLIGCANHAARTEQRAHHEQQRQPPEPQHTVNPAEEKLPAPVTVVESREAVESSVRVQEQTSVLFTLDDVRREVHDRANDADAVFQIITDRALSLTGANGAALAFLTSGTMVCRGRSGEPSPPLGAPVDVKHGLTGECVRSGVLISCEDMGNDPRVDPDTGRNLGIGSLLATPIVSGGQVVGLLEVFASQPRNFSRTHKTVLHLLVEMIPNRYLGMGKHPETGFEPTLTSVIRESLTEEVSDALSVEPQPPKDVSPKEPSPKEATARQANSQEVQQELPEPDPVAPSRLLFRALIGLSVVVVAMVLGYLVGPAMERRWAVTPQASQRFLKAAQAASPAPVRQVRPFADLEKLADQGDPDAQWQLGVRYHNGEEVARDDAQAVMWFFRAAEQGHALAQATLGAYYWAGRGVPQDLSKAYFWSTLALAQGDENSRSRLEGLASQMTKSQVSSARQQAELWLRAHNEQAKFQNTKSR